MAIGGASPQALAPSKGRPWVSTGEDMKEGAVVAHLSTSATTDGDDGDDSGSDCVPESVVAAAASSQRSSAGVISSGLRRVQRAVRKVIRLRGLERSAGGSGVTVQQVTQRARDRFSTKFLDLRDHEEQRFLSSILRGLPIMLKEATWMRELSEAVEKLKQHGDLQLVMAKVSRVTYDLKLITARFAWASVIDPLHADFRQLKEHHEQLKENFNRMRGDYLREVAFLRDQLHVRTDPDSVLEQSGSQNWCTFFDPVVTLTEAELQYVTSVVKEKLKMIINTPNNGAINLGQVATLEERVLEKEHRDLKRALSCQIQQNSDLRRQLAELRVHLQRPVPSASEAPESSRHLVTNLEKKVEELRAALKASPDKFELQTLREERDELQQAYDGELLERMKLQDQVKAAMLKLDEVDEAKGPRQGVETPPLVSPSRRIPNLFRRRVKTVQVVNLMGDPKGTVCTDATDKTWHGSKGSACVASQFNDTGETMLSASAAGKSVGNGGTHSRAHSQTPAGKVCRGSAFKKVGFCAMSSMKLLTFPSAKVAVAPSKPCCPGSCEKAASLCDECRRLQDELLAAQQTIAHLIELSPHLAIDAASAGSKIALPASADSIACATGGSVLSSGGNVGADLADVVRNRCVPAQDGAISNRGLVRLPTNANSNGSGSDLPRLHTVNSATREPTQLCTGTAAVSDQPTLCDEQAPAHSLATAAATVATAATAEAGAGVGAEAVTRATERGASPATIVSGMVEMHTAPELPELQQQQGRAKTAKRRVSPSPAGNQLEAAPAKSPSGESARSGQGAQASKASNLDRRRRTSSPSLGSRNQLQSSGSGTDGALPPIQGLGSGNVISSPRGRQRRTSDDDGTFSPVKGELKRGSLAKTLAQSPLNRQRDTVEASAFLSVNASAATPSPSAPTQPSPSDAASGTSGRASRGGGIGERPSGAGDRTRAGSSSRTAKSWQ